MKAVYVQIRKYLRDNGKTDREIRDLFDSMKVMLVDRSDGNGPQLAEWDVDGVEAPDEGTLPAEQDAENFFADEETAISAENAQLVQAVCTKLGITVQQFRIFCKAVTAVQKAEDFFS